MTYQLTERKYNASSNQWGAIIPAWEGSEERGLRMEVWGGRSEVLQLNPFGVWPFIISVFTDLLAILCLLVSSLLRSPACDLEIDLSAPSLRISQFLKCISRREEACQRSYEWGCTGVSFAEVFSAPVTLKRGMTHSCIVLFIQTFVVFHIIKYIKAIYSLYILWLLEIIELWGDL